MERLPKETTELLDDLTRKRTDHTGECMGAMRKTRFCARRKNFIMEASKKPAAFTRKTWLIHKKRALENPIVAQFVDYVGKLDINAIAEGTGH